MGNGAPDVPWTIALGVLAAWAGLTAWLARASSQGDRLPALGKAT
jgi:hypothetical protein